MNSSFNLPKFSGLALSTLAGLMLITSATTTPSQADPLERGIEGAIGGAIIGGIIDGGKGAGRGAAIGGAIGVIGGAIEEEEEIYGDDPEYIEEKNADVEDLFERQAEEGN